MNRTELKSRLDALGIPEDLYSLYGGTNWNDRCCIDQTPRGWIIYFAERGRMTSVKQFLSEDDACESFLQWVTGQGSA